MIDKAFRYCKYNNLRLTEPRQKVLEILATEKQPLGAYDLLDKISTDNNKVNPPTIYRAIDFWLEHGFIHKITSLNKYIICNHNHDIKQTIILICNNCNKVEEICENMEILSLLSKRKFVFQQAITEVKGTCYSCSL